MSGNNGGSAPLRATSGGAATAFEIWADTWTWRGLTRRSYVAIPATPAARERHLQAFPGAVLVDRGTLPANSDRDDLVITIALRRARGQEAARAFDADVAAVESR